MANLCLALLFLVPSIAIAQSQNPCYELVWSDEFDGPTIDGTKWGFEVNGRGGGNNELQYYTDRPENAQIVNGKLQIIARAETYTGPDGTRQYTSARMRTLNKGDWTYGRIEASMKLPYGQGMWPAFWMLPTNYVYGGWPQSGEIDIMENVGFEPDVVHGTIHYGPAWPNNKSTGASVAVPNASTQFHTYAIEWEEDEIRWYVDGSLYSVRTPADVAPDFYPFDQDFHLLLNVAVGGNWPGSPDGTTVFPQVMEVDYVRVYKGLNHYAIAGDQTVFTGDTRTYTVGAIANATYSWTIPAGSTITSGQGTNSITVNWAGPSGNITCAVATGCENTTYTRGITVAAPLPTAVIFDDFDGNTTVEYDTALTTGNLTRGVPNPAPGGVNPSANVGQYARAGGSQYDVLFLTSEHLGSATSYVQGSKVIFMDLYTDAPVGTVVTLNLEDASTSNVNPYPAGRHSTFTATTTVQNGWETLEFNFSTSPDAQGTNVFAIDQLALLFNSNSFTDNTYYFDNFKVGSQPEAPVISTDIIEDFDGTSNWREAFINGVYTAPAANPAPDATNPSANVAQYVRNPSEQYDVLIYDSLTLVTDGGLFTDGDSRIMMELYTTAPVGTPLQFNLENSVVSGANDYPNGRHSVYQAVTTVQNAWETITFDFAFRPDVNATDNTIDQLVFLFNSNSNTDDTYYFDNVRIINTSWSMVLSVAFTSGLK